MRQRPVDLSVIVVNHNTRELLRDCLASLYADLAASPWRVEVVAVDNGSTDASPEMIRDAFPQTRLIANAANLGLARGMNQGIALSSGAHVLLLNSDTVVRKGAIGPLIRAAGREPSVGGVAPTLLNPDGTRQQSWWPSPWKALLGDTFGLSRLGGHDDRRDQRRERWVDWLSSAALLVPRTVLDRVGTFDERFFYGVDLDWAHRAARAGFRFLVLSDAEVVHRGRGSRRGWGERGFAGGTHVQDLFFRKHYGRPGVFLFRTLLALGGLIRLVAWELAHWVRPSPKSHDQRRRFRRLLASAVRRVG